jgi:hypothetical protein
VRDGVNGGKERDYFFRSGVIFQDFSGDGERPLGVARGLGTPVHNMEQNRTQLLDRRLLRSLR